MAVDPRAEARERTGGRFDVRVLEPSPAGFDEAPWFADDPVAAPGTGRGPLVSPVHGGDQTWDALAAVEPDLAGWCADRWLGAWRRLGRLDDVRTFGATRDALHTVAEHVLAPARHAANGKIGLRFTHRGFGTPFFWHDDRPTQLRVAGTDVVVVHGDDVTTTPLSSVLASQTRRYHALLTPKPVEEVDLGYPTVTAWSPDAVEQVDAGAAAQLADWYGFACSVLEELRATQPDRDATRVQLWPEHFDMSIDLGDDAAGARGTFGASPGDDAHPEPYLYVTHWASAAPDAFWNDTTFGGASLSYPELVAAGDQRDAALEFFRTGQSILHPASVRSS
jgi:hypothetical protein